MASCTTDAWRNYAPRVRLTVTESSSNSASATYSWKLELIIDSKPAANARPYGAVIDGETVAEGSFAIARSPGTYEIDSGTITIDRSTSVRTVQFSCYMDFADMTWSGTVGGYQDARGSFTLSAKPSYTVSYNANGGSGAPSSQTKWYGSSLRLSSNIPARTGYTFKSWTTSSNGSGTSYAPGASYTQNSAVTLYAQWTANTFSVIYNANGGINPPANQTKTYGVSLTLSSSIPTRANYNFLGWGISATATTIAYPPGGTYVQNSSITLYAIWEIAFIPPRVNNFSAFRCTSDGTASDSGTYFKVSFNWTTDKPLSSIKVRWKTASGTIWTNSTIAASGTIGTASSVFGSGAISVDNSYDVEVIVTDTMGSTPTKAIVPGRLYPIDVLGGGHGVSIGKPAEIQDCFDVVWDIREKGTRLEDKYMKMADWLNVVYPVNSIYITFSHTSPANLFGGTWTRLSSYFLYGTGAGGVIGETGGSTSHTLTIDEMPSHRHDATLYAPERAAIGSSDYWAAMYDKSQTSIHTTYVGGGKAFEIVPPFIKVSIWRRVS